MGFWKTLVKGLSIAAAIFIPGSSVIVGAIGKVGAAVLGAVVSGGISSLAAKQDAPKSASNAQDSGVMVNIQDNVASLPIVYGRRRIAARQIYLSTTGPNNKYLQAVYAISEGEIAEIENIIFGEEYVFSGGMTASSGTLSGASALGRFTNKVSGAWKLGTTTQTAFSGLITATAGQDGAWTADHKGLGVALVWLQIEYDKEKLNQLPTVYFDIKGKKISTTYGGGAVWSDNPACVLLDYLTNTTYGKGLALADIDQTSFEDARDYCDEVITISTEGGTPNTAARYTANGFLDPDTPVFENIKSILSSFNGYLAWVSGKYKIKILKEEPLPVDLTEMFEFNENNIIGQINMQLVDKSVIANRVKATFYNQGLNWISDSAIWEDEDLKLLEDSNQWLEKEINLPFTSEYNRARMLAKQTMVQSRYQNTASFIASPDAIRVEIGDRVWLSHPYLGYKDDYRVMGVTLNEDKTIGISLLQYDDDIYSVDQIASLEGEVPQDRATKIFGGEFGVVPFAPANVQYYDCCPGAIYSSQDGIVINCDDVTQGLLGAATKGVTIDYYKFTINGSYTFDSKKSQVIVPLGAINNTNVITTIAVVAVSTDGVEGTASSAFTLITNTDASTLCPTTGPSNVWAIQVCDGTSGVSANNVMNTGFGKDESRASARVAGPGTSKWNVYAVHGRKSRDASKCRATLTLRRNGTQYYTSTKTVTKTGGYGDTQTISLDDIATMPTFADGDTHTQTVTVQYLSATDVVQATTSETALSDLDYSSSNDCWFSPPWSLEVYQVCNGTSGSDAAFNTDDAEIFTGIYPNTTSLIGFKIRNGEDVQFTNTYEVKFVMTVNGTETENWTETGITLTNTSVLGYNYYIATNPVNWPASGTVAFDAYVRAARTTGSVKSEWKEAFATIVNPDSASRCNFSVGTGAGGTSQLPRLNYYYVCDGVGACADTNSLTATGGFYTDASAETRIGFKITNQTGSTLLDKYEVEYTLTAYGNPTPLDTFTEQYSIVNGDGAIEFFTSTATVNFPTTGVLLENVRYRGLDSVSGLFTPWSDYTTHNIGLIDNPDETTFCAFRAPQRLDIFQVCNGVGSITEQGEATGIPITGATAFYTGAQSLIGFKITHGADVANTTDYEVQFDWTKNGTAQTALTQTFSRVGLTPGGHQCSISSSGINFTKGDTFTFTAKVRGKTTIGGSPVYSSWVNVTSAIVNPEGNTSCIAIC